MPRRRNNRPSSMKRLFSILFLIPAVYSQTSFANDFLVTKSTVYSQASLSVDIQDIFTLLSQNDHLTAFEVYTHGRNSKMYDESGDMVIRTLESLALEGSSKEYGGSWHQDPTYLFHVYALTTAGEGTTSGAKMHLAYADRFVRTILNSSVEPELAVEVIISLVMWMYTAHELTESVDQCKSAEYFGMALEQGELAGVRSVDEAMAYWIGQDASTESGSSMFSLTQSVAKELGLLEKQDIAPVNEMVKDLYLEISVALTMSNGCQAYSKTTEHVYHLTNRLLSVMKIPLIQKLILALIADDKPRIELYALAIIPQLSSCNPSAHSYLQAKLYDEQDFDVKTDLVPVMRALNRAYDCLGLVCADIAAPQIEGYKCYDINEDDLSPIGGYTPTTPVHQYSRIDLDILQIKLLVEMGAYKAADDLYTYGKHSIKSASKGTYRSLKSFATTKERYSVEPFFDQFTVYFDDQNYGDTIVQGALNAVGRFGEMSSEQRAQFVVKTIQYQIMYMIFLTELHNSVEDCFSEDPSRDKHMMGSFDRAIAYVTGSLEGSELGGSRGQDGVLLYNLVNRRCADFDTCLPNKPGVSMMIGEYLDLFYSGKGQLESKNCQAALTNVHKIEHVITIPLIQSVIRYAIKGKKLPSTSPSKYLAEGEVFSLTLLPIIDTYESYDADVIEKNMIMNPGVKPVKDGPQVVADSLFEILDEFGIPCAFIGKAIDGGVDICMKVNVDAASGAMLPTVLLLVFWLESISLFFL